MKFRVGGVYRDTMGGYEFLVVSLDSSAESAVRPYDMVDQYRCVVLGQDREIAVWSDEADNEYEEIA